MLGFGSAQRKIEKDSREERGAYAGEQILHIAIREIYPDPLQARRIFAMDKLRELADSIAEYGVLSPLIVRRVEGGYQLIADYGITQEEAAKRIGKSQSAVANKLRLLRFDQSTITKIRAAGLSERHARALLRLTDADAIREAIDYVAANELSVAETETYVAAKLAPPAPKRGTRTPLIRDVRLFLNTVHHALRTMTEGGLPAEMEQTESPEGITLVIHLPKKT